ncbi:hypothetical protein [Neorhodopirellula lusitana]|uniref:hypothetical protein n=1 Tax=Neorhodopirellula lusitana TaxID=445327 RepID=UPI00384F366D
MSMQSIERQFTRIGARVNVHPPIVRRWGTTPVEKVSIDIGNDAEGEFFDLAIQPPQLAETQVIDVQPSLRHLLLMLRQDDGKHKFLCGHDERHWFVAAVPERAAVSTVRTAFDALKPVAVRALENRLGVKPRKRDRRRNEAFIRQGEWFFVPVANDSFINERLVLRNEPIARGGGKPHMCEEIVRQGGELVYIAAGYPQGVTESQRMRLISRRPKLRHLHWVAQRKNPSVFVHGRVRHPDHKTIILNGWHQVLMNTENESSAMRHVAFID